MHKLLIVDDDAEIQAPGPNVLIDGESRALIINGAGLAVYAKHIREKLTADKALGEIVTIHGEDHQYRPAWESGDSQ